MCSIYNFSNYCKYTCFISFCQKQFFAMEQQLNRMKTGTKCTFKICLQQKAENYGTDNQKGQKSEFTQKR